MILTDTNIERVVETGTAQSVEQWLSETHNTFDDIWVCKSLTCIMSLASKAAQKKYLYEFENTEDWSWASLQDEWNQNFRLSNKTCQFWFKMVNQLKCRNILGLV